MNKKQLTKKVLSVMLCLTMMGTMLYGCSKKDTENNNTSKEVTENNNTSEEVTENNNTSEEVTGESKYKNFLTVDVYSAQANFQGIQTGWFAKVVKDKFNMELNIIAPNVAGGGDTLFQTRSASGNLGDLILTNADQGRLKDLVTADLVLDMKPYITDHKNITDRQVAVDFASSLAEKDGIWAMPSNISILNPLEPNETNDPTCAPSIRWDLYKQLGYPVINTLEDLLPLMKDMQEAAGESPTGKKVYAFSLFKDWDGDVMQNGGSFSAYYGYNLQGFALYNPLTKDIHSVVESDSQYVRGLKFLFQANQMGLVDPESTTQTFDTLDTKYKDNAVLFAFWPWMGTAQNSKTNTDQGIGFATATIQDGKYLSFAGNPLGLNTYTMMIGSKTKDPQRMVDFVDWLYSPEGVSMLTTGPEGLTWEMRDGQPYLTEFGEKYYIGKDKEAKVPEEWGGGSISNGNPQINFRTVGQTEINPLTGTYYALDRWDSYISLTSTSITKDWSDVHEGYVTPIKYFRDKGYLSVVPGVPFAAEKYSTELKTTKEQCKQIILQDSWQMCFAKDEEEFNKILKDMQDTVKGLGFDEVYEFDKKNCEALFAIADKYIKDNK